MGSLAPNTVTKLGPVPCPAALSEEDYSYRTLRRQTTLKYYASVPSVPSIATVIHLLNVGVMCSNYGATR